MTPEEGLRRQQAGKGAEEAFFELARLYRWRLCHFRPLLDGRGRWRTALTGDPGYPDWTLVRGQRLVFVELKTNRSTPSMNERDWLRALTEAGAEVYVVRWPADLARITEVLRAKHRPGAAVHADADVTASAPPQQAAPTESMIRSE